MADRLPYIQIYVADYHERLGTLDKDVQFLWFRIQLLLHRGSPRGYLTYPDGSPLPEDVAASKCGILQESYRILLAPIISLQVYKIDEKTGVLFDPEMVESEQKRQANREYVAKHRAKKREGSSSKEDVRSEKGKSKIRVRRLYVNVNANANEDANEEKRGAGEKGKFVKPTAEQVTTYAKSIGFVLDGEKFCAYYESKGWVVGKSAMKNWQAAVKTWKSNQDTAQTPAPPGFSVESNTKRWGEAGLSTCHGSKIEEMDDGTLICVSCCGKQKRAIPA